MDHITIIGVDYSTDNRKTGLALGAWDNGKVKIADVTIASEREPAPKIIAKWLTQHGVVLLALDAPLGWPEPMGRELSSHSAGRPVQTKADEFFSRLTDRVVRDCIAKKPLEVGANLIARTTHSALRLLEDLRNDMHTEIPLVCEIKKTGAIEVYPAATLIARNIKSRSNENAGEERLNMVRQLGLSIEQQALRKLVEESPHAFDAVVCITAASDFLQGSCIPVDDMAKAKKEGWIWVFQRSKMQGQRI